MQSQEASSRGRAAESRGDLFVFALKVLIINDVNLSSVVLYFLHLFIYLKLFNFYTRAILEGLFVGLIYLVRFQLQQPNQKHDDSLTCQSSSWAPITSTYLFTVSHQCPWSAQRLSPVTIKGKGAVFPLLDHTCILRVGCEPWRRSRPEGGSKSIRRSPEGTRRPREVECGSVWCRLTWAALKQAVGSQIYREVTNQGRTWVKEPNWCRCFHEGSLDGLWMKMTRMKRYSDLLKDWNWAENYCSVKSPNISSVIRKGKQSG